MLNVFIFNPMLKLRNFRPFFSSSLPLFLASSLSLFHLFLPSFLFLHTFLFVLPSFSLSPSCTPSLTQYHPLLSSPSFVYIANYLSQRLMSVYLSVLTLCLSILQSYVCLSVYLLLHPPPHQTILPPQLLICGRCMHLLIGLSVGH